MGQGICVVVLLSATLTLSNPTLFGDKVCSGRRHLEDIRLCVQPGVLHRWIWGAAPSWLGTALVQAGSCLCAHGAGEGAKGSFHGLSMR